MAHVTLCLLSYKHSPKPSLLQLPSNPGQWAGEGGLSLFYSCKSQLTDTESLVEVILLVSGKFPHLNLGPLPHMAASFGKILMSVLCMCCSLLPP